MRKIVIPFGLIAGATLSAMMLMTIPFYGQDRLRKRRGHRLHDDGAGLADNLLRGQVVSRQRGGQYREV